MTNFVRELSALYPIVEPLDFYRSVFPSGALESTGEYVSGKYCGIACEVFKRKKNDGSGKPVVHRYSITDDLHTLKDLLASKNFVLLSPISYFGKSRATKNAAYMYAFGLEIDDIRVDAKGKPVGLYDLVHQFTDIDLLPMPTYIVASGHGIHLYFLLDEPLRLTDSVKKSLAIYKHFITRKFWNKYITKSWRANKVQYESAFQAFRLVGGVTKRGERTVCFQVNTHPVSIDYLNSFIPQKERAEKGIHVEYEHKFSLEEAQSFFPEWYERRVVNGEPKKHWTCKRDLYDWWIDQIDSGATVGHRYNCLLCLSVYAIKCGIDRDELENDMFKFLDKFDDLSEAEDNRFTEKDVMDALQCFEDKELVTFPINSIVQKSGIPIEKNKRNGRKQKEHLFLARRRKEDLKFIGELINEGRPSKANVVKEWRRKNPEGTKAECIRETGLTKPTVYKWWKNEIE